MRTIGMILLGLALLAPPAAARRWATVLGESTLSRARLGVVARVDQALELPGRRITVLRLAVDEVIWGKTDRRLVQAIVADQGLGATVGRKLVTFLVPLRTNLQVINLFFLDGKQDERRLAVLRRHLALERLPEERRDAAHRALILEGLVAADDWAFYNTLQELRKRIRDTRGLLEPRFRKQVSRLAFTLSSPPRKAHLRRLLVGLPVAARPGSAARPAASRPAASAVADSAPLDLRTGLARVAAARDPQQRERALLALAEIPGRQVEQVLARALLARAPAQRRAAAFALGSLGAARAAKPLIGALLVEPDPSAARMQMRALGLLRVADAVPALARRLERPETCQEGLLALARIRTPEALVALSRFRAQASASAPWPALSRLAGYYLAPAFVERDRQVLGQTLRGANGN